MWMKRKNAPELPELRIGQLDTAASEQTKVRTMTKGASPRASVGVAEGGGGAHRRITVTALRGCKGALWLSRVSRDPDPTERWAAASANSSGSQQRCQRRIPQAQATWASPPRTRRAESRIPAASARSPRGPTNVASGRVGRPGSCPQSEWRWRKRTHTRSREAEQQKNKKRAQTTRSSWRQAAHVSTARLI